MHFLFLNKKRNLGVSLSFSCHQFSQLTRKPENQICGHVSFDWSDKNKGVLWGAGPGKHDPWLPGLHLGDQKSIDLLMVKETVITFFFVMSLNNSLAQDIWPKCSEVSVQRQTQETREILCWQEIRKEIIICSFSLSSFIRPDTFQIYC